MKLEIENSYEPISEAELIAFEKELGAELPTDYRHFLLSYNGGRPKPNIFDVRMGKLVEPTGIDRFLGLKENEPETLSRFFKTYAKRLPKNLLAIATEISVDLICLSIDGDNYGKVYFWDHNWEVTDREPDYSNVYLVAENFSDFLERLYPFEEGEYVCRQKK